MVTLHSSLCFKTEKFTPYAEKNFGSQYSIVTGSIPLLHPVLVASQKSDLLLGQLFQHVLHVHVVDKKIIDILHVSFYPAIS